MDNALPNPTGKSKWAPLLDQPSPHSYVFVAGRWLLGLAQRGWQLAAFALITLSVIGTRWNRSAKVVHPLISAQILRAGIHLLPIIGFLALAVGFVVIGQTIALLSRVGAQNWAGTVMVTVVVRELGPMATALVVLMRVGTATVIELGTARALGEVEALEALGIDPVHYLVVPKVLGMAVGVLALTIYLILGAIFSGYLFAFLQGVPLTPGEYFRQLALALAWQDFALLALKSLSFGLIIAIVTSFQGLARPLELQEVSIVTTQAVVTTVVSCVMLDALFMVVYLVM